MQISKGAKYWINKLGLISHPEGGHYREVYRSISHIHKSSLPDNFNNKRNFSTSIYFLLKKNEISAFHRLKSDETWYFHTGDRVEIYVISPEGELSKLKLGLEPDENFYPQLTIPKDHWFAAKCLGDFTLMGCNVSPGFDFKDFELAEREKLIDNYPQYADLITRFTLR